VLLAVGIDCGVIKLITLEYITPHYQAYDKCGKKCPETGY